MVHSELFEQQGLIGLLPLLPLIKDGKKAETIQRMFDVLRELDEKDLLALGYGFASLVFTTKRDSGRLIERFSRQIMGVGAPEAVHRRLLQ